MLGFYQMKNGQPHIKRTGQPKTVATIDDLELLRRIAATAKRTVIAHENYEHLRVLPKIDVMSLRHRAAQRDIAIEQLQNLLQGYI